MTSCSTTQFSSKGRVNISLSKLKNPPVYDQLELKREFYLWGTVPAVQEIDLDKEILQQQHLKVTEVTIRQVRSISDYVSMLITLGLYSPIHYQIQIRGVKYEADDL